VYAEFSKKAKLLGKNKADLIRELMQKLLEKESQ